MVSLTQTLLVCFLTRTTCKNCDTNHTPQADAYAMLLLQTSPMPGQQNCPGKRMPVLAWCPAGAGHCRLGIQLWCTPVIAVLAVPRQVVWSTTENLRTSSSLAQQGGNGLSRDQTTSGMVGWSSSLPWRSRLTASASLKSSNAPKSPSAKKSSWNPQACSNVQ